MRIIYSFIALALTAMLWACGGDPSSGPPPATAAFAIGGQLSGLNGGTVVVSNVNEAGQPLLSTSVTANGPYALTLASGTLYHLSITAQPTGQACTIVPASGTANGDINNLNIACAAIRYRLGGKVFGNAGVVALRNTANNDTLTLTSNGDFVFSNLIPVGGTYGVEVVDTSAGQACTVVSNSGTATADVSNIVVNCSAVVASVPPPLPPSQEGTSLFTIGGRLSGLAPGGSLLLEKQAIGPIDRLVLTTNGPFTFTGGTISTADYNVSVLTQPAGQTCSLNHGSGRVDGANVTDVAVTCVPNTYTIGGTVSNMAGAPIGTSFKLELRNNGTFVDTLTLSADGAFAFLTRINDLSIYNVTLTNLISGNGFGCSVIPPSGDGTVHGANVTTVQVACGFPIF